MLVGAFSVSFVPDVKPDIVSVSSDGIVRECVDVTVQGGGLAAVDVIEQDCAAAIWALMATAQATAPATANFFIVKTPVECLAASLKRPCCGVSAIAANSTRSCSASPPR